MALINLFILIISDVLIVLFFISSLCEGEYRAAGISAVGLILNSGLWYTFIFYTQNTVLHTINVAVIGVLSLFIIFSLLKFFSPLGKRDVSHIEKYDERDYMFSRNMLKFHSDLAQRYYREHSEKKSVDEAIHQRPELGEPGHTFYDPYESPIFSAAFGYLEKTQDAAFGRVASQKKDISREKVSDTVKKIAFLYGAVDVGIASVKPHHMYSHRGRQPDRWGEKIEYTSKSAIVIVVAMDVGALKQAPALPCIQESAHQYVECAKVADIIAEYIRGFGYNARSHKDGFYETLCVPLAVDAGLGVLGRLGIFMHPVHGPCVRLSVVTTDLELVPSGKKSNIDSMEKFCIVCKKCAENCPTRSITDKEEPESRGVRHWSIDQEKCFAYWKKVGTDCGVCIRVCPYTKPNTLIHKLLRFYVSRNPFNQRLAVFGDDLFYGRRIPVESITGKN